MVGIYKITNPKGKIYIGQSMDIKGRAYRYKNLLCKGQRKIYNSILKYGWLNHTLEIIEECSVNELNEREIFYSNLFKSTDKINGLNIRECGGSKGKLSIETKQLIREANIGKKHTEESKQKIRDKRKLQVFSKESLSKLKGRRAWNKGVPQTKEVKDKLRLANIGKTGKDSNAKIIFQYDELGFLLNKYYGAREVERKTGYKCASINRAARGERNGKAYGFKWKYEL